MPYKPKRPCRYPGCPNLCDNGNVYCDIHNKDNSYDAHRETSTERGYDARWRAERKRFLQHNPLCVKCMENGILRAATVVDHIKPHRGDTELFWDRDNWQPLCETCHNSKTGHGL